MNRSGKNIVWLTEWLPTPLEPYAGDGIERRAKAASLYNNIFIIYVKKNPHLRFGKTEFNERIYNDHCRAFIYFYPSIKKFSRFFDFFLSNYYFARLHFKALRIFKKKYGKPSGIQVNVAMKNGIIALYCKWIWKIKYIVVEGWSLFLPEEKPQFKDKNRLFRFFTCKVLKRASLLVTVSKHLGEMINRYIIKVPYKVIPSVVDQTIFFPAGNPVKHDVFRFIHISNLTRAKNIQQILLALKKTLSYGCHAELIIYAPVNATLKEQISLLNLEKNIVLNDEAGQPVLADAIRASDALILFSLYETFGNVIIEAQACGLPVITSDYPTFFETVENNVNGIIARGRDASALAEAMIYCIQNQNKFDWYKIAADAIQRYSFENIGKRFDEVYTDYF
ncbi:MAG: glycosyltransferase [Chitinophagales bacterium]